MNDEMISSLLAALLLVPAAGQFQRQPGLESTALPVDRIQMRSRAARLQLRLERCMHDGSRPKRMRRADVDHGPRSEIAQYRSAF